MNSSNKSKFQGKRLKGQMMLDIIFRKRGLQQGSQVSRLKCGNKNSPEFAKD